MWPSIEWPGKDTRNAFSNRLIFVLLVFRPAREPSPRPLWVTQSDCITEQIVFHSCENNSVLLLPGFTLYFPPVHVTSQFICSPVSSVFISLLHHQPPPTLYHLLFSSCESTSPTPGMSTFKASPDCQPISVPRGEDLQESKMAGHSSSFQWPNTLRAVRGYAGINPTSIHHRTLSLQGFGDILPVCVQYLKPCFLNLW